MLNLKMSEFMVSAFICILWWGWWAVAADPQTNLLNSGSSQYKVTNPSSFYGNLNSTLSDIKAQLGDDDKHFATAQGVRGDSPVYALFQCRKYLSTVDCLACLAAATTQIRNFSAASGGRVIYDGCFLRYESNHFFDDTTLPGNSMVCGNQSALEASAFTTAAAQILTDLQVATPRMDGFFAATIKQVSAGSTGKIYAVAQCAETVSESGCQDCLTVGYNNIQSCIPRTDGRAFDAGCFVRYSTTPFFADNQTMDITPFLKSGSSKKKLAIVGGVVGGVAFALVLLLAVFAWFKLSRRRKRTFRGDILGATELQGPVKYRYKDLKSATKSFSEENKLGEGGFSDVYKGTLRNGNIVAVKKLFLGQSTKVEENFQSEVKIISNVHHRNLTRLLGCCSKGPERILVFEYMANGSLDNYLFGEKRGSLNWKQRYDIILGTAKGLAYLHEEYHVRIIHRDIKPSNILLDDDLHPKIADFGLARLLPEDQTHVSTRFAGTLGYTAPEYAIHGQLSEKADTYSYGVVVLEILSGKRRNEVRDDVDGGYLLQQAWKLYDSGNHLKLVDETLDPNEYDSEEVKNIIEVALMCTQSSVAMRPIMSEVVIQLRVKGSMEATPPTMPVFVDSNFRSRTDASTSTGSSTSNATASISHISAR